MEKMRGHPLECVDRVRKETSVKFPFSWSDATNFKIIFFRVASPSIPPFANYNCCIRDKCLCIDSPCLLHLVDRHLNSLHAWCPISLSFHHLKGPRTRHQGTLLKRSTRSICCGSILEIGKHPSTLFD